MSHTPHQPKRVLFLSHSPNLAGAETSLLLLCKNLERARFVPVVAVPK